MLEKSEQLTERCDFDPLGLIVFDEKQPSSFVSRRIESWPTASIDFSAAMGYYGLTRVLQVRSPT